jgi:hypothetical protein
MARAVLVLPGLDVPPVRIRWAVLELKVTRPAGHHPDEIAAMLDAVPDLRKALKPPAESSLRTSSAPST